MKCKLCNYEETYNGYSNYETWLLCLNIDNDQGLYNSINETVETNKSEDDYELGEIIRKNLEELCWVDTYNIYKISDTWTTRDWHDINWREVATTRREG